MNACIKREDLVPRVFSHPSLGLWLRRLSISSVLKPTGLCARVITLLSSHSISKAAISTPGGPLIGSSAQEKRWLPSAQTRSFLDSVAPQRPAASEVSCWLRMTGTATLPPAGAHAVRGGLHPAAHQRAEHARPCARSMGYSLRGCGAGRVRLQASNNKASPVHTLRQAASKTV